MRRLSIPVTLVLIALAGCSHKPDATPGAITADQTTPAADPSAAPGLALADAKVQLPAVPGRPAVAYFMLSVGPQARGRLVSVHVDHFARAELHQSRMEGNAMTMAPVDALPLVPGKPIVFAPGSYHVMLFDADGSLQPGGHTELTITLDSGDKISASANVVAQGQDAM